MNVEELQQGIDRVIRAKGDPEIFHGMEDELMVKWIIAHATEEELEQFQRLWTGEYTRWYA